MPLTIRDAQDAPHSAWMTVVGWAQEFMAEFMRPVIEIQQAQTVEQVLMMFEQMPAEVRAAMEKQNPEQYAQVMKQVEALKKNQKRGG